MFNVAEEEIIAKWVRGSAQAPLVSVCITTYNTKKYFKKAIDSVLMQEGGYSFEILIHDDASDDGTKQLIQEYTLKYPKIIKPFLRHKNIFSQGDRCLIVKYNFARALGEYISILDGDDYWISKKKVFDDINILESFPKIGICFSPQKTIGKKDDVTNPSGIIKNFYDKKIKIFSFKNVIEEGGGFMGTSSITLRKNFLDVDNYVFQIAPAADIYIQVLSSKYGAVYYPKINSVYRNNNMNSATNVMINNEKLYFDFYMRNYRSRKYLSKELGFKKSFKIAQSQSLSIYFSASKASYFKKFIILLVTIDMVDLNNFIKRIFKSKTFHKIKLLFFNKF